jgi:hypothetical protein
MLSSHAAVGWILETVNFPAARCDAYPVPKVTQDPRMAEPDKILIFGIIIIVLGIIIIVLALLALWFPSGSRDSDQLLS